VDAVVQWLTSAAAAWWVYPVVFALIIADALVVVLPSETVVVALGTLAVSTGEPQLAILLPVAALGAIVGDSICFAIGRRVEFTRWRWLRGPRATAALAYAERTLRARAALVILTARYVPFARIAANLTAGAIGFPYRRFLPLSAIAGCGWALYNVAIGTLFGRWLGGQPILAMVVSVVVAVVLGVVIDRVIAAIPRRIAEPVHDGSPPAS
jgi:membrane protein DedA with SNARE-associated domain